MQGIQRGLTPTQCFGQLNWNYIKFNNEFMHWITKGHNCKHELITINALKQMENKSKVELRILKCMVTHGTGGNNAKNKCPS